MRVVRPLIAEGKLFRPAGAPAAQRPAYMVYPEDPKDSELLSLALDGLRRIAAQESEI